MSTVQLYGSFGAELPIGKGLQYFTYQYILRAGKCPTYVYSFDHRPSFSPYPQWVHADHAFDVPYVMGDVMTPEMEHLKPSQDDITMSKTMMAYWANFAKTGYVFIFCFGTIFINAILQLVIYF